MLKYRWLGDDKARLRGATALDCLRMHCHGDHSLEARNGDIDAVMNRIATNLQFGTSYKEKPTLEERAAEFIKLGIAKGWIYDVRVT